MALVDVNWKPAPQSLRNFGLICVVFCVAVGAWIDYTHAFMAIDFTAQTARSTAYVLWGVAAASALLALVAPRLLYPVYITLTLVSLPIGYVISHIVMAILYYIVFTPVALVFKIMRRDALERQFERDRESYWVRRDPIKDRRRYFRQY